MKHTYLYKRSAAALLAAALLLPLTACGQPEEVPEEVIEIADTVSGQTLTAGAAADDVFSLAVDFDKSLNPLRTTSSASLMVSGLVYDNVFEVSESFELSSRLITDVRVNEEGNFFTLVVDTTVPMHDGSTLTAYDVAYSLTRAQMYSPYFASRLSSVQGVSAYSDSELCISTKYPDTLLPYRLTIPVVKSGSILSTAPAGSGPYMFGYSGATLDTGEEEEGDNTGEPGGEAAEGESGEEAEPTATPEPTPSPSPSAAPELIPDRLNAFSRYKDGAAMPLETIYLRQYEDPASMISEYESALVDLVVNDPTGIYNMGYGGMNERRVYPTTHMHYIGFNGYSNFMCYAAYRHAFSRIVDREGIASSILDGAADAAALPINPASSLYNAELAATVDYDPQACLLELQQQGAGDLDGDGEIEFSLSGSKMEIGIDFIVCSDSAAKVTAARKIADDMQALGIPVTLRELSWKDFQEQLANPRDKETRKATFDMYYDEVALTADWDLVPFFQEVDEELLNIGLNYGRWKMDSMSNAVNNYMLATDATRKEACDAMCQELLNTALLIPVCFERRTVISHLGVIRGLNPNQYNIFGNMENWTINLG